MPKNLKKDIINAKVLLEKADAILIISGAGMSVDSGIPTYRGKNGLWEKTIKIYDEIYSYNEISSLAMWKKNPDLVWGFKSNFYKTINEKEPHQGYYDLLTGLQNKNYDYFIATSNVDGYFHRAGFDSEKIYEVHGTIENIQCTKKWCNERHGVYKTKSYPHYIPPCFEYAPFIACYLPNCTSCNNILRPNISLFGDDEFYGVPYEHQRRRLNTWLKDIERKKNKLIILEIGCGINPHSLRMCNGKMMSGEWKMPIIENNIGTIRINPDDIQEDDNETIHISLGAQKGIHNLFN